MIMHTGGCLCGSLHYELTAKPVKTGLCHCRHCQKQTATAFALICIVPETAVKFEGSFGTFETIGDNGRKVQRHFCTRCGSGVFSHAESLPGLIIIKGGSFDDPSWLAPEFNLWCDSAEPWVALPELGANFAQNAI